MKLPARVRYALLFATPLTPLPCAADRRDRHHAVEEHEHRRERHARGLDERPHRDALRVRLQRLRDARRQELPAHHHRAAAAGQARRDLESVLEGSHGMLRR